MKVYNTFFKENTDGKARAEIVQEEMNGPLSIRYYNLDGEWFKTEVFPGKSMYYVEDAAENWTKGIKVLNG